MPLNLTDAVKTLADLVPAAASTRPSAVGVVGLERTFSWAEVAARTETLARTLVAGGVQKGDRVCVLRPKGHESFEAVHAIVRAGAVVVPIDPLAPARTVESIVTDAGSRAVIGDAGTLGRTGAADLFDLVVATGPVPTDFPGTWNPIDDLDTTNMPANELPVIDPDDPAYIIYTSGSTGTPKGILHTHRSGLAYARVAVAEHAIGPDDRLAAMTGLHFDMSTLELWAFPLAGACVVQMSEPHLKFPASFTERASETGTTVWYAVTFLLQQILERGGLDERDLGSVRSVLFAGEVFPNAQLRALMTALPHARFENVYGPAEVNASNVFHLEGPPSDDEIVPVGPGIGDARMLVVDEDERPVPAGEKGVLWVSAPTLMRGYWNRPDLTAASIRRRADGPDWYVTGDVVSMDDDGVVTFHGRADHQVKLRGVRIELESVDAWLTSHPAVRHAVCGPDGVRVGALAAVIVPDPEVPVSDRDLQRWAASGLPPVAIPGRFERRTELPLTPSEKIDRKTVRAALAEGQHTSKEPIR